MLKDRQFIFEITMKRKRYVKFSWVFLSFLQIFLDICRPTTYNKFNRYDHATKCAGNRFVKRIVGTCFCASAYCKICCVGVP